MLQKINGFTTLVFYFFMIMSAPVAPNCILSLPILNSHFILSIPYGQKVAACENCPGLSTLKIVAPLGAIAFFTVLWQPWPDFGPPNDWGNGRFVVVPGTVAEGALGVVGT